MTSCLCKIAFFRHRKCNTACGHNAQKKTYSVELKQKKGKLRVGLLQSLAFLKQQVMVDICSICSCLIGVESPAVLLPFLNCFTYVLMVTNFHAFPFFQLNSPSITHYTKPAHKKFRRKKEESFDIVLSSCAIGYSENPGQVFNEVFRILRRDGLFVFCVVHPIALRGRLVRYGGRKYWGLGKYFYRGKRLWKWKFKEKVAEFYGYGRTFGDYFNPLVISGFVVEKILEQAISSA